MFISQLFVFEQANDNIYFQINPLNQQKEMGNFAIGLIDEKTPVKFTELFTNFNKKYKLIIYDKFTSRIAVENRIRNGRVRPIYNSAP